MRIFRMPLGVVVAVLLVPSACLAHALAPSLLEIHEAQPGRVEVRWRTPSQRAPGCDLAPLLPSRCSVVAPASTRVLDAAVQAEWILDCGPQSLVGASIGAQDITASGADVLLRVTVADGRSFQGVLTPENPEFVIPQRQRRAEVVAAYARLGFLHILGGWDHLLFVLGLLLLVPQRRALLKTITAFTAGHSVTLTLAALGVVHVAQAAAEAAIALSIFVVAVELGRAGDSPATLLRSHPWPMAALFGLLHGLGFAGALAEAGLPAGDIPLALASFNIGIEIGQIAFVIGVLAAGTALTRVPWRWPRALELAPVYVIGSCAAFWMIDRSSSALEALLRWGTGG